MQEQLNTGHHDPYDYCPLKDGKIPVSSGKITRLPAYEDPMKNKIFQIEDNFQKFRDAKLACRKERLGKYYRRLSEDFNIGPMISWIIDKFVTEYPEHFTRVNWTYNGATRLVCHLTGDWLVFDKNYSLVGNMSGEAYLDAFDALSMQVPEDLVVVTARDDGKTDYASYIHLCHANGWSAEWAIGKSFQEIHEGVTNIDKMIPKPEALVRGLIMRGPQVSVERVGAISFRTDTILNRHTDVPDSQRHKPFHPVENPHLYMRFERQTVTGFPECKSFLFTIKTYFYDCDEKNPQKRQEIIQAFNDYSSEVYSIDFLKNNGENIVKWLKGE